MAKKLKPPYATPKRGLPIELKYDWAMGGFADINRGFLYAIREKYGAAATLEIYEMFCKMGDRVKKIQSKF